MGLSFHNRHALHAVLLYLRVYGDYPYGKEGTEMLIEFSSAYAEIILLQPIQTRVFFLFPRTCKGYPLLTKVCVISVVFFPYFWEFSCLGERNLTDHCLSPRVRGLSLRQRGHRSSSIPFSSCVRGLSAHSTTALN